MHNRRDFIGRLAASIVGLSLAPRALLWEPQAAGPAVAAGALLTIDQITREMARRLARDIDGTLVADFHRMTHANGGTQTGIDMALPGDVDHYGLDPERYVAPAAAAMVRALWDARAHRFGVLDLPMRGARSAIAIENGIAVRGVIAYNPAWDRHLLRFDVLYASA